MKSLLGLSYRVRTRGADFTAEVLQRLIIGHRKVTLSVTGGEAQGHHHVRTPKRFPYTGTEMTFCPIHTFLQRLPEAANFSPPVRIWTPYSWTPKGCCLIRCAKRLQQSDALALLLLLAGCDLWCEGEGLRLGCGLLVSSWSWTGNIQQLSSKSATTAPIFTWASEDTDPPCPHASMAGYQSVSLCIGTPTPASYLSCKMWMDGLFNEEITLGPHVILLGEQYCTTQHTVYGIGCENTS